MYLSKILLHFSQILVGLDHRTKRTPCKQGRFWYPNRQQPNCDATLYLFHGRVCFNSECVNSWVRVRPLREPGLTVSTIMNFDGFFFNFSSTQGGWLWPDSLKKHVKHNITHSVMLCSAAHDNLDRQLTVTRLTLYNVLVSFLQIDNSFETLIAALLKSMRS